MDKIAVNEEAVADRLPTESPRQRQFREDMEDAGIKVRTYSGRNMFGKMTYGVDCGFSIGPTEQEVYGSTEIKLLQDSMGRGTILYVG